MGLFLPRYFTEKLILISKDRRAERNILFRIDSPIFIDSILEIDCGHPSDVNIQRDIEENVEESSMKAWLSFPLCQLLLRLLDEVSVLTAGGLKRLEYHVLR